MSDLNAELERQAGGRPPSDKQMRGLRDTHSKVMDAISTIQMREKGALQEQEKDLLRAFRARLWDVQFELENEKSKKDDGEAAPPSHTPTLIPSLPILSDPIPLLSPPLHFLPCYPLR